MSLGSLPGLILVLVQLLSLGLNRWADVVQTRNRGRTGGIRQVPRQHDKLVSSL